MILADPLPPIAPLAGVRGGDDLSDLDVVVIMRTPLAFFDRLHELGRLIPPAAGGVDLLAYTPDEFDAMRRDGNAFAEMVAEEGQVIYERAQD